MAFRGSLQDIRLFVAAYEEGSFTAAATREASTQSGVSHHINRLETLLGVKLFIREKATITTTPAADAFYRHCVELLRSLDKATDAVMRYSRSHQGYFKVGIMPALTHRIVAPVLLRFSELHPNVKVHIRESYSGSLPSMVANGEIDFAIGTIHGTEAGVRSSLLLTSPECLIARCNTLGAPAKGAINKGPINMVWATGMQSRRNAIEAWFSAHGSPITAGLEIESPLATLDMVSRSDWKTITPALMLDPVTDSERFTAMPLDEPQILLSVMLIERMSAELSLEAAAFVQLLVQEAAAVDDAWKKHFNTNHQ